MKLVFVRHGESIGNASGDYSAERSDSLSEKGLSQADDLADRLNEFSVDLVLSSPLNRAMQTVLPYLKRTGRCAEIWPELSEACWQEPTEETADSFPAEPYLLPDEFKTLFSFRDGNAIRVTDRETYATGRFRVESVFKALDSLKETAITILAVSHGHFIREFLNILLRPEMPFSCDHRNTGLTSLTFKEKWNVDFINR